MLIPVMYRYTPVDRFDGPSSDTDRLISRVASSNKLSHIANIDIISHTQSPSPLVRSVNHSQTSSPAQLVRSINHSQSSSPAQVVRTIARPDSRSSSRLHCSPLSWMLTVLCLLLCLVIAILLQAPSSAFSASQQLSAYLSTPPAASPPSAVPYSTTLSTFLATLPPALNYQHPNHTCVLFSNDPAYPSCPLPPAPPLHSTTHIDAALTVCGSDVQQYAITHLKSWMLHQPPNTTYTFYILTDDTALQSTHFSTILATWPRQPTLHFLNILTLASLYQSHLNEFKRCATARVYLPLLLPTTVQKVVYMDVDTLLLGDPRRVWQHFDLFHSNRTLVAFAWETSYADISTNWYLKQPTVFPFVAPWGLNSGVMLMDVSAVRLWQWRGKNYTELMVDVLDRYRKELKLGDQDWYNAMLETVRVDSGGTELLYVVLSETVNWRVGSGAVGGVELAGGGGGGGSGGVVGSGWDDGGVVVVHGNDRRFMMNNVWLESLYRTFYYWQGWRTAV